MTLVEFLSFRIEQLNKLITLSGKDFAFLSDIKDISVELPDSLSGILNRVGGDQVWLVLITDDHAPKYREGNQPTYTGTFIHFPSFFGDRRNVRGYRLDGLFQAKGKIVFACTSNAIRNIPAALIQGYTFKPFLEGVVLLEKSY